MEKFELELTEENIEKTITQDYLDNNKKICDLSRLVNEIDTNILNFFSDNLSLKKCFEKFF